MKYRFIALLGLLLFSLTACSLAEDVTPPPGYMYSTPQATLAPNTETPAAAATFPSANQPGGGSPTLASTQAISGTAGPLLTFNGKVTNASGSAATGPLTATLYLYNSGSSSLDKVFTAEVQTDGQYQFSNIPADTKVNYFVTVEYSGVTYTSDPVVYDGTFTSKDLPVTIYDSSTDLSQLSITQIHMQFDFSTNGQAQARMLYIVSNIGTKSVVVKSDGTSIPFLQVPPGATGVQFQQAQGGSALVNATNGFALLPGTDKQYAILATFSLAYPNHLDISQPFTLPVSAETIIVPVGVQISSPQLSDAGVQNFQGTNYHLYSGGPLASGSTLTLAISGTPGGSTGGGISQQTVILIGVAIAGLLLIGAGIFLFRRDRTLASRKAEPEEMTTKLPGDNRDGIMDAIIALDDQYKSGCISKEVYDKRRDELKKKLRELL